MIAADRPSSMLAQVAVLAGLALAVYVTALLKGDVKLPGRCRRRRTERQFERDVQRLVPGAAIETIRRDDGAELVIYTGHSLVDGKVVSWLEAEDR